MDRLTFEGLFCDIAQCRETPGGSYCEDGMCSQRETWERLKAYEDTGLTPEEVAAVKLFLMGKSTAEITEFDGISIDRLKELAKADKDGRVCILPKSEIGTCGSCGHFHRVAGTRQGTCDIKPCRTDRWGHIYPNSEFTPQQSRKACKQYFHTEEAERALKGKDNDESCMVAYDARRGAPSRARRTE